MLTPRRRFLMLERRVVTLFMFVTKWNIPLWRTVVTWRVPFGSLLTMGLIRRRVMVFTRFVFQSRIRAGRPFTFLVIPRVIVVRLLPVFRGRCRPRG